MPKTFSEDDAQRIFALAAERQQRSPVPGREELSLDDLIEAGRAAGIDPEHIRAAATDLMRPERLPVQRTLLGVPTEVRVTRGIPHATLDQVWEDAVERVRAYTGRMGVVIPLDAGRRWDSVGDGVIDTPGRLSLLAEREDGGIRITIERNRRLSFNGPLLGAGLFLAVAIAIALQGLVAGTTDSLLVALLFSIISATVAGSAWFTARRFGHQDATALPNLLAELDHLVGSSDAVDEMTDERSTNSIPSASPQLPLPASSQATPGEATRRTSPNRHSS